MTREEAISWLTNEKWTNANNKYKKEWNEAFDLAIEALSAENSNAKTQNSNQKSNRDLSSKAEINKWLESLKAEIGKSEHRALWHYAEAIDMAIEALSAEYEDYEHATLVDIKEPLKVLVVRCKDCRYWEYEKPKGACIRHTEDTLGYAISTGWDDFCSFGERREP